MGDAAERGVISAQWAG